MEHDYSVVRVTPVAVRRFTQIVSIIYRCGKNMAKMENLHHWDNPRIVTLLIVCRCSLKNRLYLVFDGNRPIATFQTRIIENKLQFQKLAVDPIFSGCGIGTYCIEKTEQQARKHGCKVVSCEVYDMSKNAIEFYKHRGYEVVGKQDTLRYTQLIMAREL